MNSALFGLVAAITWGIHDFIGRFASRSIGQLNTTFGLTLSGLIVLSIISIWRDITLPSLPYDIMLCAIAGGAYALATLSLFAAYRIGSMSIVSPIAGSYPAIAVFFGLMTGSRPGLYAWMAIAGVIIGTFLVSRAGQEHEDAGYIAKGQLGRVLSLSVATALFFATSLIAGQAAAQVTGEFEVTWVARGFAVMIILPFFAIKTMRAHTSVRWLPALVIMGLLDTVAMLSIFAAGKLTLPELAIVIGGSFGAIVTILAWLILKEPVTRTQWLGIALICGGAGILSAGW